MVFAGIVFKGTTTIAMKQGNLWPWLSVPYPGLDEAGVLFKNYSILTQMKFSLFS